MELSAFARVVLDLLVTRTQLGSADSWLESLSEELSPADDEDKKLQSTSPLPADQILQAVDAIVPHLADYKTFSENLCGLLKFCQQQCGTELLAGMVCKWLASTSPSPPPTRAALAFRRWLYQYVQDVNEAMLSVDAHQYKQSLLLAALQETHPPLQQTLLRHIDENIGSLGGAVGPEDTAPPNREEDPMRLLVFFWWNTGYLSQSVALCAVKFSAMAASSSAETENVLAFLRWARLLKPLFFENFVKYAVAIKVFPRVRHRELQLVPAIGQLIQSSTTSRASIYDQLRATQKLVQHACEKKALHLRIPSASQVELVEPSRCGDGSTDCILALVAQDLAVLHPDVFPHALVVFVSVIAALLTPCSVGESSMDVVLTSIQSLVSLLGLRTDASSLLFLLAAVVDLQIMRHPVWLHKPQFFQQIVGDLSEQFILETDATKRWVQRILLHLLLLESDTSVLLPHRNFLEKRLPSSIRHIVNQRFGP